MRDSVYEEIERVLSWAIKGIQELLRGKKQSVTVTEQSLIVTRGVRKKVSDEAKRKVTEDRLAMDL